MKRLLIAAVAASLALLVAAPVSAVTVPEGLTGTITIVATTETTVTVHAEQTGGEPVRLVLEHFCYQGETYVGKEYVRFTGSTDATFSIGPRTFKGNAATPTECWVYLTHYMQSSTAVVLDGADTLGSYLASLAP